MFVIMGRLTCSYPDDPVVEGARSAGGCLRTLAEGERETEADETSRRGRMDSLRYHLHHCPS